MEDGEAPSIADVIGTAIAEDLAGVLVSLEGQVVNAESVRVTLHKVKQQRLSARSHALSAILTARSPAAVPAKRARHHGNSDGKNNHDGDCSIYKTDNPKSLQQQRINITTIVSDSSPSIADNAASQASTTASIPIITPESCRAPRQQLHAPPPLTSIVATTVMVAAATAVAAEASAGGVNGASSDPITEAQNGATSCKRAARSTGLPEAPKPVVGGACAVGQKVGVPSARGTSWKEKQRLKQVGMSKKKRQAATRGDRNFDHSKWRRRTVAVQLMYEGERFAGFCSQSEGNEDTIEKSLFHALTTTKLVDKITTGVNYSRCGRTDRGVSALGNVITVCARSKFPKSLDADLPSMPLGALWVEQTRDGNNGGGSSSSGTGAGSESAKTGSGKDTDQSQDGPENNAAQSASVEEKWGSASSGSGGSSISVVTGANEAEKEGQRHDKHMSSVDTGAGADVGAMYAGVGEGEASMVEAVCDTQAVAPAAPAGLLIAQKSMKVRGDTGEPVAERCSEASAGEKISVANQEEAADRTDGCAVGIIACSSGHDDGDRDGSRVRNVQDDDDNDDRHVAELSSAARSGGAVLKAKSEKHKDKVNVSSAQDVGKGGKRGGMMVREMDYCTLLNRVLPPEIRALAWAPVTDDFSARFSCSDRTYRYFFLERDLDIQAMDTAAAKIVGEHDFRNLCKIDVANVSNFVRLIKHASVKVVPSPSADYAGSEYYRICVFEVCGQAFLWHMVRCLMSVLFMVGRGLESPEIMSFLLDLDRCPAKPHYDMAPDGPLLLHSCRFRSLQFQYTPEVYATEVYYLLHSINGGYDYDGVLVWLP